MRPEDQGAGQAKLDAMPHYTVVPRTLIFAVRKGDRGQEQILLLQGAPDKRLWAGKYNGLGGHLEPGESPEASARRELHEETGLDVERLDLRGVVHIALPEPPGIVLFVFLATGTSGKLVASSEGQPVWVDRDRLPGLPLVEDIPELLPRLLAADRDNGIIYGIYHVTDDGLRMAFS